MDLLTRVSYSWVCFEHHLTFPFSLETFELLLICKCFFGCGFWFFFFFCLVFLFYKFFRFWFENDQLHLIYSFYRNVPVAPWNESEVPQAADMINLFTDTLNCLQTHLNGMI